jgi:catechol 2,3-dioxygenase-like lactoylglutathione lyase family enzyme
MENSDVTKSERIRRFIIEKAALVFNRKASSARPCTGLCPAGWKPLVDGMFRKNRLLTKSGDDVHNGIGVCVVASDIKAGMHDMTTVNVVRSNTILYCLHWRETVDFYRDILGLSSSCLSDWLVEFALTATSFISIADAARATVGASGGAGITISWQVGDLEGWHRRLTQFHVATGPIQHRWGSRFFYFHDPEGHRLEAWADAAVFPLKAQKK